jgi:hypothetical protein
MAEFVQFTLPDDRPIYINVEHIEFFTPDPDNPSHTRIAFVGPEEALVVDASIAEVLRVLKYFLPQSKTDSYGRRVMD